MASKNLTEQTQNSLNLIKYGLDNAESWLINTIDNTKVANFNYNIYSSSDIKTSSYPTLPIVELKSTLLPIKDLAQYLNSLSIDKNLKTAVLAKSISEQGGERKSNGYKLKGINNNYFGIQTDSGNWGLEGTYITGRTVAKEGTTNKTREFASFDDWKGGAKLSINKVKNFGIYIGGIPNRFPDNPYYKKQIPNESGWATSYYYEWVRSSNDGVNVLPITNDFINVRTSIYKEAQSLIS